MSYHGAPGKQQKTHINTREQVQVTIIEDRLSYIPK